MVERRMQPACQLGRTVPELFIVNCGPGRILPSAIALRLFLCWVLFSQYQSLAWKSVSEKACVT